MGIGFALRVDSLAGGVIWRTGHEAARRAHGPPDGGAPAVRACFGSAVSAAPAPPEAHSAQFLGLGVGDLTPAVQAALTTLLAEIEELRKEARAAEVPPYRGRGPGPRQVRADAAVEPPRLPARAAPGDGLHPALRASPGSFDWRASRRSTALRSRRRRRRRRRWPGGSRQRASRIYGGRPAGDTGARRPARPP